MLDQLGSLTGTAEKAHGAEGGTPSPRPLHEVPSRRAARARRPRWVVCTDSIAEILVRFLAFVVATTFFFGLPILALYGYDLPCSNRYLLYVPFVFGAAFSSYYFGSCVTIASDARISPTTTLKITAAGSAACAILAAWIGFQIFLPKSCEPPKAYVHILWLPSKTIDQTQYDILNKHWPLALDDQSDGQVSLAFGYQIEISREQSIPLKMRVTQDSSSYLCTLNVNVHAFDLPKQQQQSDGQAVTYKRDQYNSVYELAFDKDLNPSGSSTPQGKRNDCFKSQDGEKVESIDIHPNAAKLVKPKTQERPVGPTAVTAG